MTESQVSITAAFGDAWNRMVTSLFRPFRLEKWMALGFTAWLAQLGGGGKGFNVGNWGGSSGSGGGSSSSGGSGGFDGPDWSHWSQWVLDHPFWVAAGLFGCLIVIALVVVVLWLSSRGKFMFLDNVVHDRSEVVSPWKRFRSLGDSLLGFQLAFVASIFVLMIGVGIVGLAIGKSMDFAFDGPLAWLGLLIGLSFVVLLALTLGFTQYFLDAFVVPLMHRYDLRVLDAWRHFGTIFRRHPWTLLLSGVFVFIVGFVAVMTALVAGVLTCCIGLILIMLPYIGTVVLLPIPVTYRGFTVALLDQMDPGFFPDGGGETPVSS